MAMEDLLPGQTGTLCMQDAWVGINPSANAWLYWDIDTLTGERTFGITLMNQHMALPYRHLQRLINIGSILPQRKCGDSCQISG